MKVSDLLAGVHVAVVTPFNKKGDIHWDAFEKHLTWLSENGVQGFVPCGTTGEGSTLKREEWRQLIQLSCQVAKKRNLTVTAGCGSNSTAVVLELMQEAEELGARAALVVTPYYNKPTSRGLIAHYEFLATHSTLPIVLYNVPSRTGVSLTLDTLAVLFENPQIIGIKEASG